MNTITPPVMPGDSGPTVANLQDVLLVLLDRKLIQSFDAPNRPTLDELQKWTEDLRSERKQSLFGDATQQLIKYFQVQQGLGDNLGGMVEETTAAKFNELLKSIGAFGDDTSLIVRGTVRGEGSSSAGLTVVAFDRDLRLRQKLGESNTDAEGGYRIEYAPEQFAQAEKGSADVFVEVHDSKGKVLAASDTVFNAPADCLIDLVLRPKAIKRRTELELLMDDVNRLRAGQGDNGAGLPIEDFNAADQGFVVRDSGKPREQVAVLVQAATAATLTQSTTRLARARPGVASASLPLDFFYGLIRAGLPSKFEDLAAVPRASVERAAYWSIDKHVVPKISKRKLRALLDHWDEIRAPLGVARTDPSLGFSASEILDLLPAKLAARLRSKVALATARHGALNPAALADLEADPGLAGGSGIAALKKTASIAVAFPSDPGIRRAVIADVAKRKDIKMASDLVRLDSKDWERIVRKAGGSGGEAPRIAACARELADQVDRANFGEAAHVRIERRTMGLSAVASEKYSQLLDANPTLRLGTGPVRLHDVLRAEGEPAAELTPPIVELLATDTLLETVGSALDVAELRANGFAHAGAVVFGGRANFEKKMTASKESGGAGWALDKVREVFLHVKTAGDSGSGLAIDIDTNRRTGGIQATSGPSNTLSSLMGDQGACACSPCRSVLSQSAYLADVLRFLGDATPTNGKSPLDVLLARRPDVQEVLLDCGSENVEVPYVDLVNEVLERAVLNVTDPGSSGIVLVPTTLGATFVPALNRGLIPQPIKDDLETYGVRLSLAATVEFVQAGSYWSIRDERWIVQLFLRFGGPGLGIRAMPWPQSAVTSDSDPVAPLMLLMAYERLDLAVYPWTLPFDLPAAMITQSAGARGVAEAELVRAFAPGGPVASDEAASLSRLHLPRVDLIRPATPAMPESHIAARWGFATVNDTADDPNPDLTTPATLTGWKLIAARVSYLLARSGLRYDELVRLIETKYVNPTGALKILPVDGAETCDVRKLELNPPGGPAEEDFLRIYDFVRLASATGLEYGALDILLAAVGQPDRRSTLVRLSDAVELASVLDLPVPHLAVFWGQLSSQRYSDTNATKSVLKPSVYEEWFRSGTVMQWFRSGTVLRALFPENPNATGSPPWPTWDTSRIGLSMALGIDSASFDDWCGIAGIITSSNADLDGLSKLLRNVLLARAIECPLADYRLLLDATQGLGLEDPFVSPGTTALFVNRWKAFSKRQISAAWLIAVLKHRGALAVEMEGKWQQVAEALRQALLPAWDQDPLNWKAIIRNTISQVLELDSGVVGELLTSLIAPADRSLTPPAAKRSILDYLATKSLWPNSGVAVIAVNGNQTRAIGLLQKAAEILQSIDLPISHLSWVLKHASSGGWLDLSGLPVEAPLPAPEAQYSAWENLEAWASWIQQSVTTPDLPMAYFDGIAVSGATRSQGNAALAALTGLAGAEVDLLTVPAAAAKNLDPIFPTAFWRADLVGRLTTAKALADRLGASIASLANIFVPPQATTTFTDRLLNAANFQGIVRGSIGVEKWAEMRSEFEKKSRDSRRLALVDYLVGPERVKKGGESFSANDLFERYLIDVEMSPEMRSTRLAQAIFATQLFVQRSLLRLEQDVALIEADAEEWNKWRKWYRVWEANRKVFLFPENWLLPEFRDDKSPFFKELESDLAQSDLTTERAISAFDSYLLKVEQVARLEIVSVLEEAGGMTHLIGRARQGPASYFYRTRTKGAGWARWTPWEKIDADLQGDFVIPMVQDKRFQVLWAIVSDEADPEDSNAKKWKLQFARTRRTNGGWGTKETVGDPIRHPQLENKSAEESFLIRTATSVEGKMPTILVFGAIEHPTPKAPPPNSALELWTGADAPSSAQIVFEFYYASDPSIPVTGLSVVFNAQAPPTYPIWFETLTTDSSGRTPAFSLKGGENWSGSVAVLDKTGALLQVTSNISDPDLHWYWDGSNTTQPLILDTRHFWLLQIRLGVQGTPPKVSLPANRDVNWASLVELVPQPGGGFDVSKHSPPFQTESMKNMIPYGMGYRPSDADGAGHGSNIFMSGASTANLVLMTDDYKRTTVPSERASFVRSVQDTGLVPNAVQFWRPNRDVESVLPFAITSSGGAYLGEIIQPWERDPAIPKGTPLSPNSPPYLDILALHFPRSDEILNKWASEGPSALATLEIQREGGGNDSETELHTIDPTTVIFPEGVEFELKRAGANYCWEIFLHIPWMIAKRLNENKRFAEAQKWIQLIFDPTAAVQGTTLNLDAWRCRPIREELAKNETLLDVMADRQRLSLAVDLWEQQPFQPFAIARTRIRAFAIAVLKDYIVNLVDWGDDLARRNTMEAFNEATQLYVLAAKLLGSREDKRIERGSSASETYSRLGDFDPFSNPAAIAGNVGVPGGGNTGNGQPVLDLRYFCIPENPDLQDLWARVESRLARVRSGIGVSLFGPPIDPALLVRAAAAGLDVESLLQQLAATMPPYRYSVMVQKAMEFCNEVKALGSSLLSAIEKHDSEMLGLLRASHEKNLAKLQRDVRSLQLAEAQAARNQLATVRAGAVERLTHFQNLMDLKSLPIPGKGDAVPRIEGVSKVASGSFFEVDAKQLGLSTRELQQLEWMNVANNYALVASGINSAAAIAHLIPENEFPVPFTDDKITFGGSHIGNSLNAVSAVFQALTANASFQASASGTVGSHERRRDEWAYQHNVIAAEIEQLDKQLLGTDIRVSIAEAELTNHNMVIANAEAVEDFLKTKFSNQNLYYWMARQLSGTYFRAYQMALTLATTAQKACSLELDGATAPLEIVKQGYWDGLKQGLLAGEQLALDLRRLEATYLEKNTRELEITKHISLAQLDPLQLIELRITGSCRFTMHEVLFDLDYPDHYKRRIKSVSVSLPCVVGPYAGIAGTLTMTASNTRLTGNGPLAPDDPALPDERKRIAVSSGQAESGLFEANLRDERYLPFEGAGAADSGWTFALAEKLFSSFDRETISDLVLHIRYTALAGGTSRKSTLESGLRAITSESAGVGAGMWRTFSLRHEFSSIWQQLTATGNSDLTITLGHFGYFLRGSTIVFKEIKGTAFLRRLRNASDKLGLNLAIPSGATTRVLEMTAMPSDAARNHVREGSLSLTTQPPANPIQINQASPELKFDLSLGSGANKVPAADIEDIFLSVGFSL